MIQWMIYFVAGFLLDMLATLDVQAVQKNLAYRSAFVSFIGTILSYWIFYNIIISPDFIPGLMSYALGGSIGTVFIMKRIQIKQFIKRRLSNEKERISSSVEG